MIKAIVILIIVFSVISFLFVGVNFYFVFRRYETPAYSKFLEYADVADECERQEISFYSGKNKLQGYLYGADNDKGLIVICHGIFSGARGYMQEARYFSDHGYQVFLFDYTGYCNSEGKSSKSLHQALIDCDAALQFVEGDSRFHSKNLYLYGHSWGGYTVASMLGSDHPIDAVVSVSGFDKPAEVIIDWAKREVGPVATLEYPYVYIMQGITVGKGWNKSSVEAINSSDIPIMIVHGEADDVVDFKEVSIYSHRDEITNPNAVFVLRDKDKQNDHVNLYRDMNAILYINKLDEKMANLREKYGKNIPAVVEKQYYNEIDKHASSVLDDAFFDDVIAFFEQAKE